MIVLVAFACFGAAAMVLIQWPIRKDLCRTFIAKYKPSQWEGTRADVPVVGLSYRTECDPARPVSVLLNKYAILRPHFNADILWESDLSNVLVEVGNWFVTWLFGDRIVYPSTEFGDFTYSELRWIYSEVGRFQRQVASVANRMKKLQRQNEKWLAKQKARDEKHMEKVRIATERKVFMDTLIS